MPNFIANWLNAVAEEGLIPGVRRRLHNHLFRERDVVTKLISGEIVHDQVRHHGAYFIGPVLHVILALAFMVIWAAQLRPEILWVPFVVCGSLAAWGWVRLLQRTRDLFVITDSRVFRISGVFTRSEGEMPLGRVLDIAVVRPWYLMWSKAGHLVIENAAQTQGLRDIRMVAYPGERARKIHELRTNRDRPSAPVPAHAHSRAVHSAAEASRPWRTHRDRVDNPAGDADD